MKCHACWAALEQDEWVTMHWKILCVACAYCLASSWGMLAGKLHWWMGKA